MNNIDKNIDIFDLFKRASKLYQNTTNTGFYISTNDVEGMCLGVFKPYQTYIWGRYVPESWEDVQKILKSYLEDEVFKCFYCEACAILEPNSVYDIKNCASNVKKIPFTVNVASEVNQIITAENDIRFLVCATAVQYYYNHLLLQTEGHYNSYTLFENEKLFSGFCDVISKVSKGDPKLKFMFNGNYGSNKWHFHVHVTDQIIAYIDRSKIPLENVNKNMSYGVVNFRVVRTKNVSKFYQILQSYARYVYHTPEYMSGKKYLSMGFTVSKNLPSASVWYTSYIISGISRPDFSQANTSVLVPAGIIDVTRVNLDTFTDSVQKTLEIVVQNSYDKLPDNPDKINLWSESAENFELQLPKGWEHNFHSNVFQNLMNNITNCNASHVTSKDLQSLETKNCIGKNDSECNRLRKVISENVEKISTQCTPNMKTQYYYIFSRFVIHYMIDRGITIKSGYDKFIEVYRKLYRDPEFKKIVIVTGLLNMKETYIGPIKSELSYLSGTVGSLLFTKPFENFLTISSTSGVNGDRNFYEMSNSVNDWIGEDRKQIGEVSGSGYVLLSHLKYVEPEENFIIKIVKDYENKGSFLDEFATGMILNETRKILPHFVLTLGGFDCSKGAGMSDLCETDGNKSSFLMLEFVHGEAFKKYIEKSEDNDIISGLKQILLALQYTQKKYNFTHNDLHEDNVMVSYLPQRSYYKYFFEAANSMDDDDTIEYLIETDVNCFIIDFGEAFIKGVKFTKPKNQWTDMWKEHNKYDEHRDVYTLFIRTFITYCASKSPEKIDELASSVLGNIFYVLWQSYPNILGGCGDYFSVIKEISQLYRNNSGVYHSSTKAKQELITGQLNSCLSSGQSSVQFLPKGYIPPIKDSPYATTPQLVEFIFSISKSPKIVGGAPVYTWGKVEDPGCTEEKVDYLPNNLKHVDQIRKFFKK
jgi:hypothetical protein